MAVAPNGIIDARTAEPPARPGGAEPVQRSPRHSPPAEDGLDPVAALAELAADLPRLAESSLADRLLAWLAPQPRSLEVISQSGVVPLLGAAAALLARAQDPSEPIVGLGAAALEQEMRAHRAVADRRATLIGS